MSKSIKSLKIAKLTKTAVPVKKTKTVKTTNNQKNKKGIETKTEMMDKVIKEQVKYPHLGAIVLYVHKAGKDGIPLPQDEGCYAAIITKVLDKGNPFGRVALAYFDSGNNIIKAGIKMEGVVAYGHHPSCWHWPDEVEIVTLKS